MLNIKVKSLLINDDYNIEFSKEGTKDNNEIFYSYDNCDYNFIINKDNVVFNKEDKDSFLSLKFINDKTIKGKYLVKELNLELDIDVYTKELIINDNKIKVIYIINNIENIYEVNWEVL